MTQETSGAQPEFFFYDDNFCSGLQDLIDAMYINEDEVDKLPEDWSAKVEETSFENIFTLSMDFIQSAIIDAAENTFEERLPEETERTFETVKKAISESVDLVKLNSLLPSLHYRNGKEFTIYKKDLIAFCKQ